MINFMLRLAFVGTRFSGWQIQPDVPTVQGTLALVLRKLFEEDVKLVGCCRTDAGVHAKDYIANFLSSRDMEEKRVLRALNSMLPKDIGVYEVKKVPENFNARYSVRGKTYIYRIWNSETRDPFIYPFSWHIPKPLNLEAMKGAMEAFSGKHDFSGFAKLEEEKRTEIKLKTDMRVEGSLIELSFTASHFLRYMVRRLVGCAVKRAEGKLSREALNEFLKGKHCPYTAPPQGLTLERVYL